MDDKVKAKKAAALLAARKMMKEYQKNQTNKILMKNIEKENSENTTQLSALNTPENRTPIESMASSTHSYSSINTNQDLSISHLDLVPNTSQKLNVDSGQNFFNNALFQESENNHLLTNYFDTLAKNEGDNVCSANINVQQNSTRTSVDINNSVELEYADQKQFPFEFSNLLQNNTISNNNNVFVPDRIALEDAELVQNEIYNYADQVSQDIHKDKQFYSDLHGVRTESAFETNASIIKNTDLENTFTNMENVNQLSSESVLINTLDHEKTANSYEESMLDFSTENILTKKESENLSSYSIVDSEDSPESEIKSFSENQQSVHFEIDYPHQPFESAIKKQSDNQKSTYSNTESLRQLSSQLTSLIDSETIQNLGEIPELECRNQELAALLAQERLKTEQQNLQLREYLTRVSQLETESQQIRNEQDTKLTREIGPLQEQLQYHVQTVGILVGEKTELTMALNQSQSTAKQKTSECEELQGRLRASRHRVGELEKEVNSLKAIRVNFDKNGQEYSRELERLKLEYGVLKDQFEEISEESAELREKLNGKSNETLTLYQEVQEKNSQLSLARIRIQQLTVGENMQTETQLELLNQQKISLEQQIIELTQTIKLVSAERDQASQQYQQYVQQLNGQLQNLGSQLQTKNTENENLSKREQSLIKHISELEKHLQQLQIERQNQVIVAKTNENSSIVKELEESISSLHAEKQELEVKLKKEIGKNEILEKELGEKSLMTEELKERVERLIEDQPDAGKLLATMESDKVAAARAVEQNNKLKQQLEELHEGFIKMSNSKLELTEKLETEQHHCKELSEKLLHSETVVSNLHMTISFKDKELTELQTLKIEFNKQILQQNQLLDRLRHYEAQGNVVDLLQQELKEANKNLETIMAENIELNTIITELNNKEHHAENKEVIVEQEITDSSENKIHESIRQKIEDLEKTNSDLELKIFNMSKTSGEEQHEIKNAQYLDKEEAMEQLEERFKKTITDVAELTDEKQRLEHLVLQLQSETETIGEYVTLYQCQRAMLKQKTQEKDEQLLRLEHDREEMTHKLEELNNLVRKLVLEKGDIPEEILNHKLLQNYNNYCEIHNNKENISKVKNTEDQTTLIASNNENNLGTAGKIIALLGEIKTSNLVQSSAENIQNFHPCPWCSGKLITV